MSCGCPDNACACVLVSPDNSIAIAGAGTNGNPFTLEANLATNDTDTIAFTGGGSGASPLEADVIIDPDADNQLTATIDGLFVPDPTVAVTLNEGAVIGDRPQLNFIEGSNVSIVIADDPGDDEVDITISASISAGAIFVDDTVWIDLEGDGSIGDPITATIIDGSVGPEKLAPVSAKAYSSAAFNVSNNTERFIPFDAELYDDASIHDNAVSNHRFTAPTTGRYRFEGHLVLDLDTPFDGTDYRLLRMYKNDTGGFLGANEICRTSGPASSGNDWAGHIFWEGELVAGDHVEISAFQSSGGALAATVGVTGTAGEPYTWGILSRIA